ncbi:hypothetical protein [Metabacillus fastidiosus]|uniref:hypothetical protein n=1 Tax=Metabacillus fastidiosus TaxID=1458 RepID=UPI002DB8F34D|nr:hypothetical protein [Metabacillus fastidiosus]MEC2076240.1 hypothetical protein [Metabacillus fastidiosus]
MRKIQLFPPLILIILFIAIMTGCSGNAEKGAIIKELSPKEMKQFMNEDGTGFVMLNSDKDNRDIWMTNVKNASYDQKIQVRELNENREDIPGTSNPHDWGLTQNRDSLAYYNHGELYQEIKLSDYEMSEIENEIKVFVKTVTDTY